MSVPLSQECVSVKRLAPTLKEASSVSVHLVSLVMRGVMEMDAQVRGVYTYVLMGARFPTSFSA